METLTAAVQRMTFEEKLDFALSLIEKAMNDALPSALTPDDISLEQDGNLQIGKPDAANLTFCPPECILGKGTEGTEQRLFTAGHLLYWMLTGETVYDHMPVDGWNVQKATGHIPVNATVADLMQALLVMLSTAPDQREQGVRLFLNYLTSSVRGVLRIVPVAEGKDLSPVDVDFKGQMVLHIRGTIASGGRSYRIRREQEVQYRPGIHVKRIDVVDVTGSQQTGGGNETAPGDLVLCWMEGSTAAVEIPESNARPLRRSYHVSAGGDSFVFLFGVKNGDDLQILNQASFRRVPGDEKARLAFYRKPGASTVEITWKTDNRVYQTFIADYANRSVKEM